MGARLAAVGRQHEFAAAQGVSAAASCWTRFSPAPRSARRIRHPEGNSRPPGTCTAATCRRRRVPPVQRHAPARSRASACPPPDAQPRGRSERNSLTKNTPFRVHRGVPRPHTTCTRPGPAGRAIVIALPRWLDADLPEVGLVPEVRPSRGGDAAHRSALAVHALPARIDLEQSGLGVRVEAAPRCPRRGDPVGAGRGPFRAHRNQDHAAPLAAQTVAGRGVEFQFEFAGPHRRSGG